MRVVVIGLGSIAKKHIAALRNLDANTVFFALRSGMSNNEEPGVNNFYEINQINDIDPDFVLISNPTSKREEVLGKLLTYGKPLFIEKPVLSSLEQSSRFTSLVAEHNILTYVACNLRFHGCINFVKEYLAEKQLEVNEVNVYCGSYLPEWRPGADFRLSYSALPELGGGVHLDLIHEIDYTYWMFGKPLGVRRLLRSVSSLKIKADDYANYQLLYPGFTANIVLNYYRRDYKRIIEIVSDEETVSVDIAQNEVRSSSGELLYSSSLGILDTYTKQMKYFTNLLTSKGASNMNSFVEGVDVLKIVLHEN